MLAQQGFFPFVGSLQRASSPQGCIADTVILHMLPPSLQKSGLSVPPKTEHEDPTPCCMSLHMETSSMPRTAFNCKNTPTGQSTGCGFQSHVQHTRTSPRWHRSRWSLSRAHTSWSRVSRPCRSLQSAQQQSICTPTAPTAHAPPRRHRPAQAQSGTWVGRGER